MADSFDYCGRKVGVISLPGSFNYGGKLQLYAVMQAYRHLGYAPEFLVLDRRPSLLHRVADDIRNKPHGPSMEERQSPGRRAAFSRFDSRIPTRAFGRPGEVVTRDYRYLSVGSDQAWNPSLIFTDSGANRLKRAYHRAIDPFETLDECDWYFLGFARREQRVALAPSFGVGGVDGYQARRLARGLYNFDRISVREESGARIVKELTGKDAQVICDPTLTISKEGWDSVADDRLTPTDGYVLAYLLGDDAEENREALLRATGRGDVPVVRLSDQARPGEPDAGPAEFVSLVSHASHVVTDSFHACVFASIFERPLTITHRTGASGASHLDMFSRIDSLCNRLGIGGKVFDPRQYDASRSADYEGVADRIAGEHQCFIGYLEGCLDDRKA